MQLSGVGCSVNSELEGIVVSVETLFRGLTRQTGDLPGQTDDAPTRLFFQEHPLVGPDVLC
jgi:hypothetical protein